MTEKQVEIGNNMNIMEILLALILLKSVLLVPLAIAEIVNKLNTNSNG